MKKMMILFLFCMVQIACTRSEKKTNLPADTKPATKSEECVLVASISDPKQKDEYPIQFCMYTHTEVRGIFAATACVGVLVEGQTGSRQPFYGSKGHWGIEGACDAKKINDKFQEKQTMTTVNPVSDLKMKRKQGKVIKIIKDDLGLGPLLLRITDPK